MKKFNFKNYGGGQILFLPLGAARPQWLNFLFILLITCLPGSSPSAQDVSFKCQEKAPAFTGIAMPTICEDNPNFQCETQIGDGTPFPKSSLLSSSVLSGNVCVIGDFEVDVPFTFKDALVRIEPGVTITVKASPNGLEAGGWLGIDNSKLFACEKLWKGIKIGFLSSLNTWNNSIIEDAETAIFANSYCAISLEKTTFNRNRVGIELLTQHPNIFTPGPVMWSFVGNEFSCTAPLNGTVDEITQVGVKLNDSHLFPFYANKGNVFRGIINGIVARSTGINAFAYCDVFVDDYTFDGIHRKGIDFEGRNLNVVNSIFERILGHGILHRNSSLLNLQNNQFFVREFPTQDWRLMVELESPKMGNDLTIRDNYFYTEGQLESFSTFGLKFTSYDPGTSFNAWVYHNGFDFYNSSLELSGEMSHAISVWGSISTDSDIDIENNDFNINPFIVNNNRAIDAWFGSKHGIHVIGNRYVGGGTFVDFLGSPNSSENEIIDNTLNPASDFGFGVSIQDFAATTICSNTNNGASNVAYVLLGQNEGTVFSGNHTYGGWQHSFWVTGDQPVIGQQIHTGNEWGPAIVFNPNGIFGPGNYLVRPFLQHSDPDPDIVEMSKFEIHTPQSVWNGSQYTFFSPFHPATDEIVPDFNDEFFDEDPAGTPVVNCLAQLQAPDEVDLLIANGSFAGRISNVGSVFDAKRYLYSKLQDHPGYQSLHASFGTFLATEQNTSVGKFYLLEQAIDNAHKLSSTEKSALVNAKTQRDAIIQDMGQQGMSQGQLLTKISELSGVGEDVQDIVTQQEADRSVLIANAMSIWLSITPQNVFEQYRKDVLGIYLSAQTQQSGILTEAQVTNLQEIAKLCSEIGGSAVYLAQGLLPECDRAEIIALIEKCHKMPEVESRENIDTRHILISEAAQAQVSPNPARDWVNIVSVRQMEGHAEIFSLTGQLLANKTIVFGDNSLRFDLNSGIYVLKITYDNGDISSHKLVINK